MQIAMPIFALATPEETGGGNFAVPTEDTGGNGGRGAASFLSVMAAEPGGQAVPRAAVSLSGLPEIPTLPLRGPAPELMVKLAVEGGVGPLEATGLSGENMVQDGSAFLAEASETEPKTPEFPDQVAVDPTGRETSEGGPLPEVAQDPRPDAALISRQGPVSAQQGAAEYAMAGTVGDAPPGDPGPGATEVPDSARGVGEEMARGAAGLPAGQPPGTADSRPPGDVIRTPPTTGPGLGRTENPVTQGAADGNVPRTEAAAAARPGPDPAQGKNWTPSAQRVPAPSEGSPDVFPARPSVEETAKTGGPQRGSRAGSPIELPTPIPAPPQTTGEPGKERHPEQGARVATGDEAMPLPASRISQSAVSPRGPEVPGGGEKLASAAMSVRPMTAPPNPVQQGQGSRPVEHDVVSALQPLSQSPANPSQPATPPAMTVPVQAQALQAVADSNAPRSPRDRIVAEATAGDLPDLSPAHRAPVPAQAAGAASAPGSTLLTLTGGLPFDRMESPLRDPSDVEVTPLELKGADLPSTRGDALTARMDLPRHVALQVADVARMMPDRPVELTLNPEELGRLRMTFTVDGGSMAVAVTAERPETMDLLRRHIDALAQELREIGYEDVSFDFAQGGDARGDGSSSGTDSPSFADMDGASALHLTDSPNAPARLSLGHGGGIDIRL